MNAAVHVGYVSALLFPIAGVLVGVSLIIRGEREGPWIVGFSVACATLYTLAAIFLLVR